MSDTIFYKGKLKRTKTPAEVFAKLQKSIKKKGPTKNWTCTVDEERQYLRIDFHDGASESFVLEFDDKKNFDGFCKVAFPLGGELFEDGKSELKALLDALYDVKSMFLKIEVMDDYGFAESYWDNKKFKISFRELSVQEEARVRRLHDAGCTDHKRMLLAIIAEDMGISTDALISNINPVVASGRSTVHRKTLTGKIVDARDFIRPILETYIYETTVFQKKGRVCEIPDDAYAISGPVPTSVIAFIRGVLQLFENDFNDPGSDNVALHFPKFAQARMLFKEKFYPVLWAENDTLKKCILSYRFFLSVMDFAGFRYVGRMDEPRTVFDQVIQEYGREKATIFLTGYCYTCQSLGLHMYPSDQEECSLILKGNLTRIYGYDFWMEYQTFKQKYQCNGKFHRQVQYTMKFTSDYADMSLIQTAGHGN